MLNQVVLVGRLTKDIESYGNFGVITLAVPRTFKNENGEYDTDFIPCEVMGGILENAMDSLHKGDLVGVKGRLASDNNFIKLKVEKLTFLSSKKRN